MIFIDSNIFMYAGGVEHANKAPSLALFSSIASREVKACTSVEVLQELLHRYRSIDRWNDGKKVYLSAKEIVPTIEPLTMDIVDRAFKMLDKYPKIMARDALHAATCVILNLDGICTYDTDFDKIEEVKRVTPEEATGKRG
jgi:uncharacterized protein